MKKKIIGVFQNFEEEGDTRETRISSTLMANISEVMINDILRIRAKCVSIVFSYGFHQNSHYNDAFSFMRVHLNITGNDFLFAIESISKVLDALKVNFSNDNFFPNNSKEKLCLACRYVFEIL